MKTEGTFWQVPLQVIAEARADHYADDPDTTRENEIEHVMTDDFEGVDLYQNNMDFGDVAAVAKLVKTPAPITEPGREASCRIVELHHP